MIPKKARRIPWKGLPDFLALTATVSSENWVYRGQSDRSWPLRPKAGRKEFRRNLIHQHIPESALFDDDLQFFLKWRDSAVAYTDKLPIHNLECLAYAQHYGLATRLLDWTLNPLVALFFAVETHDKKDGVVYCHFFSGKPELKSDQDLAERIIGVRLYRPRPFDRRIFAQQGLFTYHPEPGLEFPVHKQQFVQGIVIRGLPRSAVSSTPFSDLIAIIIPHKEKFGLMRQLRNIGVSRSMLFPDLDGLSNALNWEAKKDVINLEVLRHLQQRNDIDPAKAKP